MQKLANSYLYLSNIRAKLSFNCKWYFSFHEKPYETQIAFVCFMYVEALQVIGIL